MERTESLSDREKIVALFTYLREMCKIRTTTIKNIAQQIRCFELSEIPELDDFVQVTFRDTFASTGVADEPILKVTKPEFDQCPQPRGDLLQWLTGDWDDYHKNPVIRKSIENLDDETGEVIEVLFDDFPELAVAYEEWFGKRELWASRQKKIETIRNLFFELHKIHMMLDQSSETVELVAANGFVRVRADQNVDHPVLMKRIRSVFDPDTNSITLQDIEDADSEIYSALLRDYPDLNVDSIRSAEERLGEAVHPLDRNGAKDFLRILVNSLSPKTSFFDEVSKPEFQSDSILLLYMKPVILLRRRIDGSAKAIDKIVNDVENGGDVPPYLHELTSGGIIEVEDDVHEETVEERLAEVGGEDYEILLSKEANREQLEIARRIEKYDAVLVQGPPGTGKTHTIANLIGHFLAQGKSILVTSETPKALSVLVDKIDPAIRNLCVSVLGDNKDMESSINEISDYTARHTSGELEAEVEKAADERRKVMDELAQTRRKLFDALHKEYRTFVFAGEECSPVDAAKYVQANAARLSDIIPGDVVKGEPLPLSFGELAELYESNDKVTADEEREIEFALPELSKLMRPDEFADLLEVEKRGREKIEQVERTNNWRVSIESATGIVHIDSGSGQIHITNPKDELIADLSAYSKDYGSTEDWMIHAAADGLNGGGYRARWDDLFKAINDASQLSDEVVRKGFGKEISGASADGLSGGIAALEKTTELFRTKGKVGRIDRLLNKDVAEVMSFVKIDGKPMSSLSDSELALLYSKREAERSKARRYWYELMERYGAKSFDKLDANDPERVAVKWISRIETALGWGDSGRNRIRELLSSLGADPSVVLDESPYVSPEVNVKRAFHAMREKVPPLVTTAQCASRIAEQSSRKSRVLEILGDSACAASELCAELSDSIKNSDAESYKKAYDRFRFVYGKSNLHRRRTELLSRVSRVAPSWAVAVSRRDGIHGHSTPPEGIKDAWRWKQYSLLLDDLLSASLSELQAQATQLSTLYREKTARLAEKKAWLALLRRTEHNITMRQALQGWKQIVKKIGKGTGKRAPKLRAAAREKMAACQDAVPAWIMPIKRVFETLEPTANKFDVVIVDEASQADLTALGVTYMAKKVIIVGDDKQVSPMAVGVDDDRMSSLSAMYLKDVIPNWDLYDLNTSLYDVAMTTFQPLMLQEHFRCVPDIIRYSNWLSYDGKIKPLRDPSSCNTKPYVVNYRVDGGRRNGRNKTNIAEAREIVALIQACMAQQEYEGKTFGVISLLGDEQVKVIQKELYEKLEPKEIASRNLICGNPSDFQGDERDIVFLSMVDSRDPVSEGPIRLRTPEGQGDALRKRYNVAMSRARDQVWVVHSLDAANDLKPGDIRKGLLDYAANPKALVEKEFDIERKADSPFESSVCKALVSRGYKIVQQWEVGAYRIDIVVECSDRRVAIECDGERWHSGEEKIREDMERQAILERIGWRFIRIRGSEYYRDPDSTIDRVVEELTVLNILPAVETSESLAADNHDSDLLERVKAAANALLHPDEVEGYGSVGTQQVEVLVTPPEF